MEIEIKINVTSGSLTGHCNLLNSPIDSEDFASIMDKLSLQIKNQLCQDIKTGKRSVEDSELIRFFVGNDGAIALKSELKQVEHDAYLQLIEEAIRRHYPSLFGESFWHMIVPRHRVEYCAPEQSEAQYQAFLKAEAEEREAYHDLRQNGISGAKWQKFLRDYFSDPHQANKELLMKHGFKIDEDILKFKVEKPW